MLTQWCLYLNNVEDNSRGNPCLVCWECGRGGGIWLFSWVVGSGGSGAGISMCWEMAEVEVVVGHSAVNSVLVAVASPLLPCHQLLCGALSLPYPSL